MITNTIASAGIVTIDSKILFVRHTYGTAKDRILRAGKEFFQRKRNA